MSGLNKRNIHPGYLRHALPLVEGYGESDEPRVIRQSDFDAERERRIHAQALLVDLRDAARPFAEMAQEMLNGHPTGRLSPGAPERLLAALAAFDPPESDRAAAADV